MMESIENELVEKIEELIQARPVSPFGENSFPFIEDIFAILAENKAICAALFRPKWRHCFSPPDRSHLIRTQPEGTSGNIS